MAKKKTASSFKQSTAAEYREYRRRNDASKAKLMAAHNHEGQRSRGPRPYKVERYLEKLGGWVPLGHFATEQDAMDIAEAKPALGRTRIIKIAQ